MDFTKARLAVPPDMSAYDVDQLVTDAMQPITGQLVYLEQEGMSPPRRGGFGRADVFLDPVMDTLVTAYATDYQWSHWCLGRPIQPPPRPWTPILEDGETPFSFSPPSPTDPGEPNPGGGYGGGGV